MIYLAIPYTGNEEYAFRLSTIIAAELSLRGEVVYSPITHSHPMTQFRNMPGDWDFWGEIDRQYISRAYRVYVIQAEGWKQSIGVQAEIEIALRYHVPVEYLSVDTDGDPAESLPTLRETIIDIMDAENSTHTIIDTSKWINPILIPDTELYPRIKDRMKRR
jgi:hypothetical protein